MTDQQLEQLFDAWWRDSYPMAPVNKQSRASHLAFGRWLLEAPTPVGEEDSSS
jgi:hypothetical protein